MCLLITSMRLPCHAMLHYHYFEPVSFTWGGVELGKGDGIAIVKLIGDLPLSNLLWCPAGNGRVGYPVHCGSLLGEFKQIQAVGWGTAALSHSLASCPIGMN